MFNQKKLQSHQETANMVFDTTLQISTQITTYLEQHQITQINATHAPSKTQTGLNITANTT